MNGEKCGVSDPIPVGYTIYVLMHSIVANSDRASIRNHYADKCVKTPFIN